MAEQPKPSLWTRFQNFDITKLFEGSRPPPKPRTVFLNTTLPEEYMDTGRRQGKVKKEFRYYTNQVVTSKYTVLTFLPKNLLEQFRRVANVFFLFICILQFVPRFSTISPGLVILPLIVVLALAAIKDGYEDIKRHQSDRKVNHSQIRVLEGGGYVNPNEMGGKSKTFVRGLIRRRKSPKHKAPKASEAIPDEPEEPDSDDESTDDHPHWGQTNWEDVKVGAFVKILSDESLPADIIICATSEEENVCYVETKNLDGETNLKSRHGLATLAHLRTAKDCLNVPPTWIEADRPETNMYRLQANIGLIKGDKKEPIDINTVLLRGTVLRNTSWVIGIVLFTGIDSKVIMNSGATPSKRSRVERKMNPMVVANMAVLAVICIACAIADSVYERYGVDHSVPWEWGADISTDNPSFNGFTTLFNAFITFQNVIPISLYISIEFVRTCQAAFIYFDSEIYYDKTGTSTLARTWNLADDLGQVEFVVSDKTGTLTQNSMVFRMCSVGGKAYEGDPDPDDAELINKPDSPQSSGAEDTASYERPAHKIFTTGDSELPDVQHASRPPPAPPLNPDVPHFKDSILDADLHSDTSPQHSRSLNAFFTTLALCHTAIADVSEETGAISYKAQSPDESALVQAAADVGFVFRGRDRDTLKIQTPFSDEVEEYELLQILDFTSARKRMSVVVRKVTGNDNRYFLLVKGADSVVFERLRSGGEEIRQETETHLEYFASQGLRTLCLAYKVIPAEEYDSWAARYHEATITLGDDRDKIVEDVSSEIEQNLRLLGATAIEDKLQDGVPETIADLKRAGIKLWVATGDKLETAIAIGFSTNLIGATSNLIVVRGGGFGERHSAFSQMQRAVEAFFPGTGILDMDGIKQPPKRSDTPETPTGPGFLGRAHTGLSSIIGDDNGKKPGGFVLVIDGTALGHVLEEPQSKQLLLQLALHCEAVLCCRVSPLQKAHLVHLIKDGLGVLTLAIGDGANDVSMIQAADIGVGISGEEGLQAVNSSDYAIAQFRFLKRLLLVHGHWSYARNSNMIVNFFYKNIVCIAVLWWFQIYCGFSTTYVFEYTYLLLWNVFWSLAPVIAMGIFDRHIDDDILMAIPELYYYGLKGSYFTMTSFTIYMLDALYQSVIVFFFILNTYTTTTARRDGWSVSMYEFSTTMVIATVMIVNLFNGLNTHAWTGWVFFSVALGIALVWGFTAVISVLPPSLYETKAFGNNNFLFPSAYFWFGILYTIPLALLPRYILKAIRFIYYPTDIDILRWIRKTHPRRDFAHHPLLGGRLFDIAQGTETTQSGPSHMNEEGENMELPPRRSFQSSRPDLHASRPDLRMGSRTEMSTGVQTSGAGRGYDFSAEEGGVAMRRIQSNLSERNRRIVADSTRRDALGPPSSGGRHRAGSVNLFPGLRKSMRRKKADPGVPSSPPPPPPSSP